MLRILLARGKQALRQAREEAALHQRLTNQPHPVRYLHGTGVKFDAASTLGRQTVIDPGVEVQHATLGDRVLLRTEAVVRHSTAGNDVTVGKQAVVTKSVLGNNVHLESLVQIAGSTLHPYVLIHGATAVLDSEVGSYSYIAGYGSIQNTAIGKFCSIAQNLTCGPGNHPTHMISTSPAFYLTAHACGTTFATEDVYNGNLRTVIGSDVWIGANVFIKSGTVVGNGAVIAAGSVVVKDVAPYAIVGGVPAKQIRKRFGDDDIAALQQLNWWDWPESLLHQAVPFMQAGDVAALVALGTAREAPKKAQHGQAVGEAV